MATAPCLRDFDVLAVPGQRLLRITTLVGRNPMLAIKLGIWKISFLVLLLSALFSTSVRSETKTFGTNKFSTVTDSTGRNLGSAQNVCRFAGDTQSCPADATLIGFPNWDFLPGGNWIWIPSAISTSSANANKEFTFETVFTVCGAAQTVTVSALADNTAVILVNDEVVLTINGTNPDDPDNYKVPHVVNIPVNKIATGGFNSLKARITNAANPAGCSDQYQCNPAGVVATITITDDLTPWPTCTGEKNQLFEVGQFESRSCPPGQEGADSRVCVCALRRGVWFPSSNSCRTPPAVTCTGANTTFPVGGKEAVACPVPKIGSGFHTCQASGQWGPSDYAGCALPVTCMGSGNTTFPVGANEALVCPTPKVGSGFHTCQASGQWGQSDYSGCTLPVAAPGGRCRDEQKNEIATCPSNTVCQSRPLPSSPPDFWCKIFGINCPVKLVTADMFCDP